MKIYRSYHFWLILTSFVLVSLFHYAEQLGLLSGTSASLYSGPTRLILGNLLFLAPIIYSGYVFGLTAGLSACSASLLVMLPKAVFISPVPLDAIFQVSSVIAVGTLACLYLWTKTKERGKLRSALAELESAHQLLQRYAHHAQNTGKRLTMLNAISTLLAESLDLKDILDRAINIVTELMDVEIALVFSLDENTQELVLLATEGVSREFASSVKRLKVGEGFNGQVAKTGEPMVVEHASEDPRFTPDQVKKMKIQSMLIVPITLKERITGTLCVAIRRPRTFQKEEIELLTAVGAQIGTAIENARLYEKERLMVQKVAASERKYRELFENANDAIWIHDLAGHVIAANEATARLTGYSLNELSQMNASNFFCEDSLNSAEEVRQRLLEGQPVTQPYEQRLLRKDGTEAVVMLSTSLLKEGGEPVAFHHIARDVTEEKKMQENLRFYIQEITKAQEEERKRIARELHDDTTQALFVMSRHLDNFLRNSSNLSQSDIALIKQIREEVGKILSGIRRFSQDLRPSIIDDLGLLPALEWLTSDLQREYSIQVELKVLGTEQRFPPEVELMLFRIVQEALRNVGKHAAASKAEVVIQFGLGGTTITVSDNGRGFQVPDTIGDLSRGGKLGLAGMQERAALLGGNLRIDSAIDKGTTVTVNIPDAVILHYRDTDYVRHR